MLYHALHFEHRFMRPSVHMICTGCLQSFFFLRAEFQSGAAVVQKVILKVRAHGEYLSDDYRLSPRGWEHFEHQWWCKKNDSSRQAGHSDEASSPDFLGLNTLSTWWLGLTHDADSIGWVDDTHGPRLSFPTVLIALRVTRHYLRHLGKKYMINHTSLVQTFILYLERQHAFLSI